MKPTNDKFLKEIRKKLLAVLYEAKAAHIGSCLSCVDLIYVLYNKIMRIDPRNPLDGDRDRFILSKGHAVAALYTVLADMGFFPESDLKNYYRDGSDLPGHATRGTVPGVEVSTGALGHGLSVGAGMALAAKRDGKEWRAFVLCGDGETETGSMWEAALFAGHHRLDNLVAIIDYNKLQCFGSVNEILDLSPLAEKWKSFGWGAREIDGNNLSEAESALRALPFEKGKPSVLIANTVKGKGVSYMENNFVWHLFNMSKEQYDLAIKELS
jgi:transketolase